MSDVINVAMSFFVTFHSPVSHDLNSNHFKHFLILVFKFYVYCLLCVYYSLVSWYFDNYSNMVRCVKIKK